MKTTFLVALACLALAFLPAHAQTLSLDSRLIHHGTSEWKMQRASETKDLPERISTAGYDDSGWKQAVVPGTVLTSLVEDKVLPEPYYGTNNKVGSKMIPDISDAGRDYYTYWMRTTFLLPESFKGKTVWLHSAGVNYRAEFWLNGKMVASTKGMFATHDIDITAFAHAGGNNVLAVLVLPPDNPGSYHQKKWGAKGEFHNGGDGDIGLNTTQLMTVGWDFTYNDGIRDRNTGIWRPLTIYATGSVALRNPFVHTVLNHPAYDQARATVSVDVYNPSTSNQPVRCTVSGEIEGTGIGFSKEVRVPRSGHVNVSFSPTDYPQLVIQNPRLWWPKNKGPQNLYRLKLKVSRGSTVCDSTTVRFGVREIQAVRDTPDSSKLFVVNGKPIFVRGSNWIPEAMQRTDDDRMRAELRYTAQSGINMLRLWGGGVAESDLFYDLCDEYGILVWQEFWMTGDTRHPQDEDCYLDNVASVVKRLRNHPSLAFYVASNEGSEVSGTGELIRRLDGTRPFQIQSECDGVHDGSPYKQVNPMRHYENTASDRGSRIDGFNPEYGAPTLPLVESLREMMPAKDLWPINKATWDYLDGGGFHLMTTLYNDMVNEYGTSESIEEYARKAQLVGAMNSKSIWETWNRNKLNYGDRFCSGLLFWYHNNANPQVCGRMWDWMLQPTASLYHTMHALEPLHVQFDYLKNTVSVVNDYLQAYKHLTVKARVYSLYSKLLSEQTAPVDIAADGVANDVITLSFPADITPVHFISLQLTDANGKILSENFYWRSTSEYKGKQTLTGPCTAGFSALADMPEARLTTSVRKTQSNGRWQIELKVKNPGRNIAFFNQIQLKDAAGKPVRPAFASDNFFSLLPGESRTVNIDVEATRCKGNPTVTIQPFNNHKPSGK